MKNILAILAVFATVAMVGCASSSTTKSPWAAGNAPTPKAAPAAVAFEDDTQTGAFVDPVVAPVATDDKALLASYPAISNVNKQRALAEIEKAKTAEPLPAPELNRAHILNVNTNASLIEIRCMTEFKAGQRVVIAKDDYKTLYEIILVETENRYIAEEVRGVFYSAEMKERFNLVPADDVACVEWIDPENAEAVKAAAAKAKANSDDAEAAVEEDEEIDEEGGEEALGFEE